MQDPSRENSFLEGPASLFEGKMGSTFSRGRLSRSDVELSPHVRFTIMLLTFGPSPYSPLPAWLSIFLFSKKSVLTGRRGMCGNGDV